MAADKAQIAINYDGPSAHIGGFSLETDMDPEDASKVLLYAMQLIIHRNQVNQQNRAVEQDLRKKINDPGMSADEARDAIDKSLSSLKTAERKKK